jgi:hypothetical protein
MERPFTRGQRYVSFNDECGTLAISGILVDKISITVELKDKWDLVLSQIAELDRLVQHAAEIEVPSNNARYCLHKLRILEDTMQVLTGGPTKEEPSLRDQYNAYTNGSESVPEPGLKMV